MSEQENKDQSADRVKQPPVFWDKVVPIIIILLAIAILIAVAVANSNQG